MTDTNERANNDISLEVRRQVREMNDMIVLEKHSQMLDLLTGVVEGDVHSVGDNSMLLGFF